MFSVMYIVFICCWTPIFEKKKKNAKNLVCYFLYLFSVYTNIFK